MATLTLTLPSEIEVLPLSQSEYTIPAETITNEIIVEEWALISAWQPVSNSHSIEENIPMEMVTTEIPMEGGAIECGGCVIAFRPNTFKKPTPVTAKSKIDPDEWPPGATGISPSLDVIAKGMRRRAKVKLPTWCISEKEHDDAIVDVMHYDDETMEWSVIHECPLGNSRYITFKCRKFSKIIATLKKIFSFSRMYLPVTYCGQQECIVALLLDTELVKEKFLRDVEDSLDEFVRVVTCPVIACKKTQEIKCDITCSEAGFNFDPPGPFLFKIGRSMTRGNPWFQRCVLSGTQSETDIKVRLRLMKQREKEKGNEPQPQTFLWKPTLEGNDSKARPSVPSKESRSRSQQRAKGNKKVAKDSTSRSVKRPDVHVDVNVDVRAENKSPITGGVVNFGKMKNRYTDYENQVTVMGTPKKTHPSQKSSRR